MAPQTMEGVMPLYILFIVLWIVGIFAGWPLWVLIGLFLLGIGLPLLIWAGIGALVLAIFRNA